MVCGYASHFEILISGWRVESCCLPRSIQACSPLTVPVFSAIIVRRSVCYSVWMSCVYISLYEPSGTSPHDTYIQKKHVVADVKLVQPPKQGCVCRILLSTSYTRRSNLSLRFRSYTMHPCLVYANSSCIKTMLLYHHTVSDDMLVQ